jgi:hypothetical protein
MYSIFHPLDPNERLPRELIIEGRRFRYLERGTLLGIVGVLYLPVLMLSVVVLGSFQVGALVSFGVAGLILVAGYLYALKAR